MTNHHPLETNSMLEVYWRPGCPYCNRLLQRLDDAEVPYRLHNIWEDEGARHFVREHNNGNETVPTVSLNGTVLTNPDPRELLDSLCLHRPALCDTDEPSR